MSDLKPRPPEISFSLTSTSTTPTSPPSLPLCTQQPASSHPFFTSRPPHDVRRPVLLITLFSGRKQQQLALYAPRRGYHSDIDTREKALLEEDSTLRRFKSYKNTVKRISKAGDVLMILVVAECSYEIYVVATEKSTN